METEKKNVIPSGGSCTVPKHTLYTDEIPAVGIGTLARQIQRSVKSRKLYTVQCAGDTG
ncbi:MAG: hypothetical protein ACLU6W_10030 [Lachnospiraceae bacterium]